MPPRQTEPHAGGDSKAARPRLPQRRTTDDDSDVGSGAGSDAEDVSGDDGLDDWDEEGEDSTAAAMDEDEVNNDENEDNATPPELSEDELARHPLFRPVTIHVRRYPVKEVYLDNLLEAFPTMQASSHIARLLAQTQKKFQTSVQMAQYASSAATAAADLKRVGLTQNGESLPRHWLYGRRAERARAGRNVAAFTVIDENPDEGEDSGNVRSKSKVGDLARREIRSGPQRPARIAHPRACSPPYTW